MNTRMVLIVIGIAMIVGGLALGALPNPGYDDYRCGSAIAPGSDLPLCNMPSPAPYFIAIILGAALAAIGYLYNPKNGSD